MFAKEYKNCRGGGTPFFKIARLRDCEIARLESVKS
nr:MAG TPA: hypothetical protein [Caudoviricetes sp.]